jgi:VRR-NUC domain
MREADFQARIIALAERFGWRVWHVPAPMVWDRRTKAFRPAKQGAGLPDLIMIHEDPPRIVFMEVKTDGGKLSDRQEEFLTAAQTVADSTIGYDFADGLLRENKSIGVFAVWPEDEKRVEAMLRSRAVA